MFFFFCVVYYFVKIPHADILKMSEKEVREFYQKNSVIAFGQNVPYPIKGFKHGNFSAEVLDALNHCGFDEPTLIQKISWPVALSGRDVIGIAETGSGKTLAYALPSLVHIRAQKPIAYVYDNFNYCLIIFILKGDGPIVLVLAPTRELACQIDNEYEKFCGRNIKHTCLYGGASRGPQIRSLKFIH
jgi:ATP-dependent RNA helicase DDX5/DBP2